MPWQITYITWIHLVTAIISLQLILTVYNIQQIRGRVPFIWMMALSTFWSLILTFESSAPTVEQKEMWSQFEYFANMVIPLMFLRFILSYDLDSHRRLKKYGWVLWIIPVVTIILVFTHEMNKLIWTGFEWSPAGHNILIYKHGSAFYVAMAYSVGLIFVANFMLARFILKRPDYYKSRGRFLLTGSFCALLTGMAYVLGLSPVEGLDISPMGTLIAGFIFFGGISRGQLFDIIPFSHQLMIEKMKDGVIILDSKNFIMDISPVAIKALKIDSEISGLKMEEVLPVFNTVLQGTSTDQEIRGEIRLGEPPDGWFEITRYPLRGVKENYLGSLLVMHDISHRKVTETQLRRNAEELRELNKMKDRIYSDQEQKLWSRDKWKTFAGK
ncbi:MAG: histidine kinase N-terminal 7TM domain-containing protein, partial [Bacteroidota bacterium]